jgi:hypothetical protein
MSLPFVGDGQALATFRAAPFEHDSAVLRGHPDQKSVRLLASAGIRLKSRLPYVVP